MTQAPNRRTLLKGAAAMAVGAAAAPLARAGEASAATTISRSTVIDRAADWLTANNGHNVPYSQVNYFNGYRTDCSGYVSMAWNLDAPGTNTVGLNTTYTVPIGKGDLAAGDALIDAEGDNNTRHVVIFEKWTSSAQTSYWGFEQAGGTGTAHRVIPYPYDSTPSQFHPRRYKNIVDGTTPTNPLTTFGAAAVFAGGQYNVFGIKAASGVLFQDTYTNAWSGWRGIGGVVTGTPAVTYHDGRYDLFALSEAGYMYQNTWQGAWSGWRALPGTGKFAGGVGAVWTGSAYHVYGISAAGRLYQNTWAGSWSGWEDLGGTVRGTPAVTYHDGRYDVWARSPNGFMYQKTYQGSWSGWNAMPGTGTFTGGAGALWDGSAYHVFGISSGAARLYQNTYTTSWSGWQDLGGTLVGTPAVTHGPGRYDVFAMSRSGIMYQRTWQNGWGAWHSIGGAFA